MTETGSAPSPPATRRPLLERERELASIGALLDDALAGSGRLALIEGPAGIGKTRLLAEARERAGSDMTVLSARAGELEVDFPYGVVRQLFEGLVRDPARRDQVLQGAAAPAASVFGSVGPDSAGAEPGDSSFAALHGLFWLVLNLAEERPLLLAIDDLQWCDRPSLRFLAYMLRRLEGVRVLIVATWRSTDPGTDPALLAEMAGEPLTAALRPGPLSQAAAAEIVRERLGPDAEDVFCEACHDTTAGNPLMLSQLVTALAADSVTPTAGNAQAVREIGPRAVSRTVLLRLSRLPDEAVEVARAVAVLGEHADLSSVAALAGVDERQAAEATGALSRAEILNAESPLGFVHPLVREAVYRELAPGERELRHARAARLLAEAGADAEQVSTHLLMAPRRSDPWVVELLREAGASAARRGAPDSAATYLRRALEEPPAADAQPLVQLELGMAEALTNGPSATEHLQAAYAGIADPILRAQAAQMLGRALLFTGGPDDAAELARHAAAGVPADAEDLRLALEALELTTIFFGGGRVEDLAPLQRYRGTDLGPGVGAKMIKAVCAAERAYFGGAAEEAARLSLEALEGGDLVRADAPLLAIVAIVELAYADRAEVRQVWEPAIAESYRRGSLLGIASIHLWHGYTLLTLGDLGDAEATLRTAFDEFEHWGFGPDAMAYVSGHLASVLVERGDLDGAARALDRAGAVQARSIGTCFWLAGRLNVAVAGGHATEAVRLADELAAAFPGVDQPVGLPWRSFKARALDRLGRREEALELLGEELASAERWGAPSAIGRVLRLLGTLEGEAGLERLEHAVEVLGASNARLERAKALAALGSGLRRARHQTDAREPLRRALELATACEATPLAEHARTELYATGARPRSDALGGIEALTPSERRVAELAAAGETNRDIAQALYVAPKTVEVHLTNVYRKLGVRSRRDLPAALLTP